MQYKMRYASPLGEMLLACDGEGLTGAWFAGQKYFAAGLDENARECAQEHLLSASRWLDIYFSGREPDFTPPLILKGTPFQKTVWELLLHVPYGKTVSYGELARKMAEQRGVLKTSARAVGTAVGHNPVSLIVPCHRVIGADGSLTGYAGGLERKKKLLKMEGAESVRLFS